MDAHKNFAYSTVAVAPIPASSGTALTVAASDGAKFPAVPFNATVWPASTQPTAANAEIVRVTLIATDVLTITRTQESSSARTIIAGDQIAATVTALTLTDVEGNVDNTAPVTQAFADTAASGSSAIFARRDHKHGMPGPSVPTVVAVTASFSGTGVPSATLPTGHATNDILVLVLQSSNDSQVAAPATYTNLGPQNGFGAAATALSNKMSIFWKRDGGSESAPTIPDTGDHTFGYMFAIRGCPTTGDPFHFLGNNFKFTTSTTGTSPVSATVIDNCLVVDIWAGNVDNASAEGSSLTNAALTNLTEQFDGGTADGTGGFLYMSSGTKATAGSVGATTVTWANTSSDLASRIAFIPFAASCRDSDFRWFRSQPERHMGQGDRCAAGSCPGDRRRRRRIIRAHRNHAIRGRGRGRGPLHRALVQRRRPRRDYYDQGWERRGRDDCGCRSGRKRRDGLDVCHRIHSHSGEGRRSDSRSIR